MFTKMKSVVSDDKRTNKNKSQPPPPFQNKNFVQEPPPHNLNYMYLDVREVFSLSHANAG